MKCPACPDVTLSISDRQGIEIDFCPQCRGVWLDRGELDKIIERSANFEQNQNMRPNPSGPAPTQFPGHAKGGHHPDDYYKYKRKKSFLEELFD